MKLLSTPHGIPDPNSLESLAAFARVLVGAFLLGGLTSKLYRASFYDTEPADLGLARGFLVLVPALAVVFWVIKFSLVLSIGLLGSLSLLRFRTLVRRVEDAAFLMVAIAVAIAAAVEAYPIALLLLAGLFALRVGLRWLADSRRVQQRYAVVTFQSGKVHSVQGLLDSLAERKRSAQLLSTRSYDGQSAFVFGVEHAEPRIIDDIRAALALLDRDAQLHVFYPDGRIGA